MKTALLIIDAQKSAVIKSEIAQKLKNYNIKISELSILLAKVNTYFRDEILVLKLEILYYI